MSFQALTSTEVETGKPVKNSTWTKTKDNFDNLNSRLTTVEGGASAVYPPIILRCGGKYSSEWVMDHLVSTTMNFNISVTGVRLLIRKAGSVGTTEVALKWKRGAGAWTSICSTNPSVAFGAGDDALSTNAVLNASNVNLQAGDILRLDLISAQTDAYSFLVRIDFNKT